MKPKVQLSIENEECYQGQHVLISTEASINSVQPSIRYFGTSLVFFWMKGEPLITIGPDYRIFLVALVLFELFGFVTYYVGATYQPKYIQTAFKIILLLEPITYMYTAFKNPGIKTARDITDPAIPDPTKPKSYCFKCNIFRDKTIYHCLDCEVCIKGYDHHCPWTGKCIGEGNLWGFYVFLVVTLIYFVFCIALIVLRTMEVRIG